jgi:hypothetical protein
MTNSCSNLAERTDVLGRRYVQIDLTRPFEQIVATALALPEGRTPVEDKQIVNAARAVYESVHGRSVETTVGVISIAPEVCPWFLVRHLEVRTRENFLAAADQWLARAATERGVIAGPHFDLAESFPDGAHGNGAGDVLQPRNLANYLAFDSLEPANVAVTPKS